MFFLLFGILFYQVRTCNALDKKNLIKIISKGIPSYERKTVEKSDNIRKNQDADFYSEFIEQFQYDRGLIKSIVPDSMEINKPYRVSVEVKKGLVAISYKTLNVYEDKWTMLDDDEILYRIFSIESLINDGIISEKKFQDKYIETFKTLKDRKKRHFYSNEELRLAYKSLVSKLKIKQFDYDTIQIGLNVKIQLIDPTKEAFEIIPLFQETEKIISNEDFSIWEWSVIPKKSGQFPLKIIGSSKFKRKNEVKEFTIYDSTILVQTSYTQVLAKFIKENWQWLFGTLLIPFIIWITNRKSKNKQEINNANNALNVNPPQNPPA